MFRVRMYNFSFHISLVTFQQSVFWYVSIEHIAKFEHQSAV